MSPANDANERVNCLVLLQQGILDVERLEVCELNIGQVAESFLANETFF